PVDGLRLRLISPKSRYSKGEVIRLTMEIQNITDSAMVIPDLDLPSCVSEPGDQGHDWVITGELVKREGQRPVRFVKVIDRVQLMSGISKLAAGRSLRVEIEMTCGGRKMADEKRKELAEG